MFIFFFRKLYILPTLFSKRYYNIATFSPPSSQKKHLQWSQLTPQTQASVDLTTAPRLWSVSTPAIRFRSSSWEFQQQLVEVVMKVCEFWFTSWGKGNLCHYLRGFFLHPSWVFRICEPSTVWKPLVIVEKLIQEGFYRIFNVSFEFSDLCFFYCLRISSHLIYRGVSIWCF